MILLLFAVTAMSVQSLYATQCTRLSTVPERIQRDLGYYYNDTGFQLYTNLEIKCEGLLVKWLFHPRTTFLSEFHLGVFRPVSNDLFKHVGESYIETYGVYPFLEDRGEWFEYQVENPIPVKTGDILGIYYMDHETFDVAIANYDVPWWDWPTTKPTYVFLEGRDYARGIADKAHGFKRYRIPALAAYVDRSPNLLPWGQLPGVAKPPENQFFYPGSQPQPEASTSYRCTQAVAVATTCSVSIRATRAFFDITRRRCLTYDGCPGTHSDGNVFDTMQQCLRTCGSLMSQPAPSPAPAPTFVVPGPTPVVYQPVPKPNYQPQPTVILQPAPAPHFIPAPSPHFVPAPAPQFVPAPSPHFVPAPPPHFIQAASPSWYDDHHSGSAIVLAPPSQPAVLYRPSNPPPPAAVVVYSDGSNRQPVYQTQQQVYYTG